jgi:hypothetical protein
MFREIEPGVTQGGEVEVLSSIAPGTTIVARGAAMVTEGVAVQVAGDAPRGGQPEGGAPGKERPVTGKKGPGPQSGNSLQPLQAVRTSAENAASSETPSNPRSEATR